MLWTETHVYVFLHVFLFFFFQPAIVDFVNCEQCICVLFTVPQITLFSNFFIKNGSHKLHFLAIFFIKNGSHKLHFLATFLLKMGPTTLFTHFKIISLQCFRFQFQQK